MLNKKIVLVPFSLAEEANEKIDKNAFCLIVVPDDYFERAKEAMEIKGRRVREFRIEDVNSLIVA
jgi:hypothetical protein